MGVETEKGGADVADPYWVPFRHCHIGGFDIIRASRDELVEAMAKDCIVARDRDAPPRLVFDANGHALSLRKTDMAYQTAVDKADVIHADGGFLVTLSRWLTKSPISERTATTDVIHDCARKAVECGLSFYLLGGEERVNAECVKRLQQLYPGLEIVGRRHGYFLGGEEEKVIEEINNCRPDVVWVGLGKPNEQIFSVKWRDRLRCGWVVTCGGCYNYIVGEYSRAPRWMQRANLEWLHRMVTNRKLISRYLATNPHALWLALSHRERKGA